MFHNKYRFHKIYTNYRKYMLQNFNMFKQKQIDFSIFYSILCFLY